MYVGREIKKRKIRIIKRNMKIPMMIGIKSVLEILAEWQKAISYPPRIWGLNSSSRASCYYALALEAMRAGLVDRFLRLYNLHSTYAFRAGEQPRIWPK